MFAAEKIALKRLKFVCPKTSLVATSLHGRSLRCNCENPCTPSKYGRCVYIYPDADLRLYPGILRGCPEWNDLYARRTAVERSIGSFKYVLGVEQRKTFNSLTTKADLFLAGIVQLLSVVLADVLHEHQLFSPHSPPFSLSAPHILSGSLSGFACEGVFGVRFSLDHLRLLLRPSIRSYLD